MAFPACHLTALGPPRLITVLIGAARCTLCEAHCTASCLLAIGAAEASGELVGRHSTVARANIFSKIHLPGIWILIKYWS